MKRGDAIRLKTALSDKALKAKGLSTDDYLAIHSIKQKLRKYIDDMIELERSLFEDHGLVDGDILPTKKENPNLWQILDEIQKPEISLPNLNFMDKETLKKWIDDVDINSADIITEFLLKIE